MLKSVTKHGDPLKARITVTNRWLSLNLHMGNLHEVSRKIGAWRRRPDSVLLQPHAGIPNPDSVRYPEFRF